MAGRGHNQKDSPPPPSWRKPNVQQIHADFAAWFPLALSEADAGAESRIVDSLGEERYSQVLSGATPSYAEGVAICQCLYQPVSAPVRNTMLNVEDADPVTAELYEKIAYTSPEQRPVLISAFRKWVADL